MILKEFKKLPFWGKVGAISGIVTLLSIPSLMPDKNSGTNIGGDNTGIAIGNNNTGNVAGGDINIYRSADYKELQTKIENLKKK